MEPNAFLVSGKVGARRIQRDLVTIDPDELRAWSGLEECLGVSCSSQSCIDEGTSVFQRRDEELDDSVEEYRAVIH